MGAHQRVMQIIISMQKTHSLRVQMANNGGVTIDPGTAGNLWNLARQAATLYGRKMKL